MKKPLIQFLTISLLFSSLIFTANAQTISGTVFEDINYGGGAGRNLSVSAGIARPSATVELYNSAGAYVSSTTTNTSGVYTFSGVAGTRAFVRVVNKTVISCRAGYVNTLFPVQIFRTDASIANTITDVTDRVGGELPKEADAPANNSATIASLNATAGVEVQSISEVDMTAVNITGIDFGFNFSTIVNNNIIGQGSLYQFILNATSLGDETTLAQSGNTWNAIASVNAAKPLPAGKESSIFMITDGNAHPGLRVGLAAMLSVNGVAVIPVSSATTLFSYPLTQFPSLTNTCFDGGTQTANIGNTNNVTLGTGGTAGTGNDALSGTGDELVVPQLNGPEVEISGAPGQYPIELYGTNVTLRCIAVHSNSADIRPVSGSNFLLEQNVIGAQAHTFTAPTPLSGNSGAIIYSQSNAASGIIQNNLIGFGGGNSIVQMRYYNRTDYNWAIKGNEIAGGQNGTPGGGPGIILNDRMNNNQVTANGTTLIEGNLIRDCGPTAISTGLHYPIGASNLLTTTVSNNTLTRNGSGFQALFGNGNDLIVHNLIYDNRAMGVRVANRPSTIGAFTTDVTYKVKISRNSMFNNGTTAVGNNGLGIDLNEDGVTPNNGASDATFPNHRMNYPIFTTLDYSGGVLSVTGYVGSAPNQSAFAGSVVEIFKANNGDANQSGEIVVGDGLSIPHGEGETYLGTTTADANGNFAASFAVSNFTVNDQVTATATDAANNTSEFGPTVSRTIILPLKLLSFNAVINNNKVDLTWVTTARINIGKFIIEKSFDAKNYKEAGIVKASAGSTEQLKYIFPDEHLPQNGIIYYRLRSVDINGRNEVSEVRMVRIGNQNVQMIKIISYPNPVLNELLITIPNNWQGKKIRYALFNNNGQLVLESETYNGRQTEMINLSKLAAGFYLLKVTCNGETAEQKIVKH